MGELARNEGMVKEVTRETNHQETIRRNHRAGQFLLQQPRRRSVFSVAVENRVPGRGEGETQDRVAICRGVAKLPGPVTRRGGEVRSGQEAQVAGGHGVTAEAAAIVDYSEAEKR
ncbi:hypothetical protein O3P69_018503 [Scylla paramamosain]|uniref:Uncharacterized protein n=1 Tax=Scylla paramamosain TaxID=85552 RepID=A0AAW0T2J9_SCYPA